MNVLDLYEDILYLADDGSEAALSAYREKTGNPNPLTEVPLRVFVAGPDILNVTRPRVVAGRRTLEPVDVYIRGVTPQQFDTARLYQNIWLLRAGLAIEPVNLTPSGIADAEYYFQERRAGRLNMFGLPRTSRTQPAP